MYEQSFTKMNVSYLVPGIRRIMQCDQLVQGTGLQDSKIEKMIQPLVDVEMYISGNKTASRGSRTYFESGTLKLDDI